MDENVREANLLWIIGVTGDSTQNPVNKCIEIFQRLTGRCNQAAPFIHFVATLPAGSATPKGLFQ